jgi:catalase
MANKKTLTNNFGAPISDDQNSMRAGNPGFALMHDVHLIEKLAHFDRERKSEYLVHAKGASAYGYFEVTKDVTKWTKAKFLSRVGKIRICLFVAQRLEVKKVLPC